LSYSLLAGCFTAPEDLSAGFETLSLASSTSIQEVIQRRAGVAPCFLARRLGPSGYSVRVYTKVNASAKNRFSPLPVDEDWFRIHSLWFTKELPYLIHGHAPLKATPTT
jgi:hypothetical protein